MRENEFNYGFIKAKNDLKNVSQSNIIYLRRENSKLMQ
jgi:hypothetical protein